MAAHLLHQLQETIISPAANLLLILVFMENDVYFLCLYFLLAVNSFISHTLHKIQSHTHKHIVTHLPTLLRSPYPYIRLKKKNTLSQSLREFFKPTRHAVFYFVFYFFFTSIGLCLHAHPKPKMTEKFQLQYFQKSNRILHVFWAPTYLNSSKTANFLRFS